MHPCCLTCDDAPPSSGDPSEKGETVCVFAGWRVERLYPQAADGRVRESEAVGIIGWVDLIAYLAASGGIVRTSPLRHRGLALDSLPDGVQSYRGWLYLESVGIDRVRAKVYNGTVTCCSAAAFHGLPILSEDRDTRTHVAIPRNRALHLSKNRRLDDVVIHRESGRLLEDVGRSWLSSIECTLERACQCLSLRSAVAMLDAARTQRLCRIEDLRIPERGPSVPSLRDAVIRSVEGSRSILETCARLQLEDAGIPTRTAVNVPTVGEVDLIVFERLVIELDGWEFHNSKEQRAKDIARDRRLAALGYTVIRFDFDTVMYSGRLVEEVLAVREYAWRRDPGPSLNRLIS